MTKLRNSQLVPWNHVKINDSFWSKYIELVRKVVIPYQWDALNDRISDAEPSFSVRNFRIAAGEEQGEFGGFVFQDHGLVTWLEAVGNTLGTHPDKELEQLADAAIDLIAKAQQADGYVNTYFTIKEPEKRWTNLLECHELFCAGHMIEAAVSYYMATGKRKFLNVVCRYADYIDLVFGPEPGKLKGYDGHEEIELALVKLYKATNNEKYLKLSRFFIDERGKEPYYFDTEWEKREGKSYWDNSSTSRPDRSYNQTHQPVREQNKAVGHAVRAVYLYAAMADMAAESGDEGLLDACRKLWGSIVNRQMYITGGIGSTAVGEAFTFDYDLPNDTIYQETCASIGLVFFAHRMLQIETKVCYADIMERALYNSVLSGIAQDGMHFFYVNPLEVWPEASEKNPTRKHVKPVRQKWFNCACCPPNIARVLSSVGQYMYTSNEKSVFVHMYAEGEADIQVGGGRIGLRQETQYPWDGHVRITVSTDSPKQLTVGLRIPGWSSHADISINGEQIDFAPMLQHGYALLRRTWHDGDIVSLNIDMSVMLIEANPKVRADAGKVAIQRGPLVYCIEEADNGSNLSAISMPDQELVAEFDENILGGIVVIKGRARRTDESLWEDSLYRTFTQDYSEAELCAVPYYVWGNREPGEMMVWIRIDRS